MAATLPSTLFLALLFAASAFASLQPRVPEGNAYISDPFEVSLTFLHT